MLSKVPKGSFRLSLWLRLLAVFLIAFPSRQASLEEGLQSGRLEVGFGFQLNVAMDLAASFHQLVWIGQFRAPTDSERHPAFGRDKAADHVFVSAAETEADDLRLGIDRFIRSGDDPQDELARGENELLDLRRIRLDQFVDSLVRSGCAHG